MTLPRFVVSVVLVLCVTLTACDSEDENFVIEPGIYSEFGERLLLGGEVVSEGLAGVYFGRALRFSADGTFSVEVFSDLPSETGVARGRYETAGGELTLYVESTTSPIYEVGESLRYVRFEVVGGSYRTAFDIDGTDVVFEGPGIILTSEPEDATDGYDERRGYFGGPLPS